MALGLSQGHRCSRHLPREGPLASGAGRWAAEWTRGKPPAPEGSSPPESLGRPSPSLAVCLSCGLSLRPLSWGTGGPTCFLCMAATIAGAEVPPQERTGQQGVLESGAGPGGWQCKRRDPPEPSVLSRSGGAGGLVRSAPLTGLPRPMLLGVQLGHRRQSPCEAVQRQDHGGYFSALCLGFHICTMGDVVPPLWFRMGGEGASTKHEVLSGHF